MFGQLGGPALVISRLTSALNVSIVIGTLLVDPSRHTLDREVRADLLHLHSHIGVCIYVSLSLYIYIHIHM